MERLFFPKAIRKQDLVHGTLDLRWRNYTAEVVIVGGGAFLQPAFFPKIWGTIWYRKNMHKPRYFDIQSII